MSERFEVTIHDIARKLNISASTVSRALNNNHVISESTRKLIHVTAEEMGYRPNTVAANFRTKRTNTIGVIVPLINRHFFSSVISGIEEVAYKKGFTVSISQSNDLLEKECKIAQTLFANRVDGIIISIAMGTTSFEHLKLFTKKNIPIVFFDRVIDVIESHKIVVDDFGGAYKATRHLAETGSKRIAHIGGPLNLNIYKNRQDGYIQALKDLGLKADNSLIINNKLTREQGTEAIQRLLGRQEKPDAVFCANDTTAQSVIAYLTKKGIKVPDEIAVVGFSNEPFSEMVTPSISTVMQPGFLIGNKAADLLIDQIINKPENIKFQTIVMPTDLIIRDSSVRKK